jgi:hypothetical protein
MPQPAASRAVAPSGTLADARRPVRSSTPITYTRLHTLEALHCVPAQTWGLTCRVAGLQSPLQAPCPVGGKKAPPRAAHAPHMLLPLARMKDVLVINIGDARR